MILSESGNLKLVQRGGYWYTEGLASATNDDRTVVLRDVSAKLASISPEALELAHAFACIMAARTGDVAAAQEKIRRMGRG